MNICSKLIAMGVVAAALPLAAMAEGVILHKAGDVQSSTDPATRAPVAPGQRIRNGETVATGPGGATAIRFDDGLTVALNENTTLKVVEYRYRPAGSAASADRAAFELQEGAIRVVTGAMAERSRDALSVRGPHAELVSGGPTDFTVALVNPMYVTVNAGNVVAINGAGRTPLPQGSSVEILNGAATPLNVMPSNIPPAASGPMRSLQVATGTPGGPSGGAAAGTAGAGGVGLGTLAPLAIFGAAAAAAIGGSDDNPDSGGSSTTHH